MVSALTSEAEVDQDHPGDPEDLVETVAAVEDLHPHLLHLHLQEAEDFKV